eukprot:sb/3466391/
MMSAPLILLLLSGSLVGGYYTSCDNDTTSIGARIDALFREAINFEVVKDLYTNHSRVFQVNHTELVDFIANTTEQEFMEASRAIRHIRDSARESYEEHEWSAGINNSFWDGFTSPIQSTDGTFLATNWSERYNDNVSMSESAIILPINVFSNWTDVKNTIQWTKKLNEAFVENYLQRPENIYWQYIGTPQGALRSFPAAFIQEKEKDTFDVRQRPWYNEGIGCPKDVVMLIDTSGSLEGFPSKLLKTTAKKLIELILTDSDFVTAISVGPQDPSYELNPFSARYFVCNGLLQRAEASVKVRLEEAIMSYHPAGVSNWTDGIDKAFQTFYNSEKANLTSRYD